MLAKHQAASASSSAGPVRARHRLGEITGFGAAGVQDRLTRVVVYCDRQAPPVYVSEAAQAGAGEVEFADAALCELTPDCTRARALAVLIWQHSGDFGWRLVDSAEILLTDLMRYEPGYTVPTVILRVHRALYVRHCDNTSHEPTARGSAAAAALRMVISPSSADTHTDCLSYQALVQIWTLEKCIDDARQAVAGARTEIDRLLPGSCTELLACKRALQTIHARCLRFIETVKDETASLRSRAASTRDRATHYHDDLCHSLTTTAADTKQLASENLEATVVQKYSHASGESPTSLAVLGSHIAEEQSRLAVQLMDIFPIEFVGNPFHFSICALPLPPATSMEKYDPVQIGAALGFVAQVVHLLSRYLDTMLPYPVHPYGSLSFVIDPVSNIKGSRVFPLWTKGALLYRIEYGLYLLHRDIERLMAARDVCVADMKQTLANLKNLLLIVAAGGPANKAR